MKIKINSSIFKIILQIFWNKNFFYFLIYLNPSSLLLLGLVFTTEADLFLNSLLPKEKREELEKKDEIEEEKSENIEKTSKTQKFISTNNPFFYFI